jgi:hypothetical protein
MCVRRWINIYQPEMDSKFRPRMDKNIDICINFMGRTKTKPFLKRKKVPKLYFHFWPPKKCPPFFFLIHTWWCPSYTLIASIARCELNSNMCVRRWINIYQPEMDSKFRPRMDNRSAAASFVNKSLNFVFF